MDNQKIKEASLLLLDELKQEIEKERPKFSRIHELMSVVYEPVRFLASRETNINFKN